MFTKIIRPKPTPNKTFFHYQETCSSFTELLSTNGETHESRFQEGIINNRLTPETLGIPHPLQQLPSFEISAKLIAYPPFFPYQKLACGFVIGSLA